MKLITKLKQREKRLNFLYELRKRGLEIPDSHICRVTDEIKQIRLELEVKKVRIGRNSKIDTILNCL